MKKIKDWFKNIVNLFKNITKEKLMISICVFMAVVAIVLCAILIASARSNEPESTHKKSENPSGYDEGELYPQVPNSLEYQSLGDGSCIVVGIGTYDGEELQIPEKNYYGDTVIGIAADAFEGCSELLSVDIPATVISIGEGAFKGCSSLVNIGVARSNTVFSVSNGVLYSKNKAVLICYPAARVGAGYLLNSNIKSVAPYAFYGVHKLSKLNYEGTAEEFSKISVGEGNKVFISLPITCNYSPNK